MWSKKWPEDLANISGPNCCSTPYWIFSSRFFSNDIFLSLKRTLFLNRTSAAFTILSTLWAGKMRLPLCLKQANFAWRGYCSLWRACGSSASRSKADLQSPHFSTLRRDLTKSLQYNTVHYQVTHLVTLDLKSSGLLRGNLWNDIPGPALTWFVQPIAMHEVTMMISWCNVTTRNICLFSNWVHSE